MRRVLRLRLPLDKTEFSFMEHGITSTVCSADRKKLKSIRLMSFTLANKEKTFEQHLPVLLPPTILYMFLVFVSPGTKKFLQKVVMKFQKSSYSAFLKSK